MHNAEMDIEFDPAKARSNETKHNVSFTHAEQALRDSFAVTIADPDSYQVLRIRIQPDLDTRHWLLPSSRLPFGKILLTRYRF